MEITELIIQNPWWKDKSLIEEDYDILQWKKNKFHWMPNIVNKMSLEPFAFHIITGPRQAGKTTALKLLIQSLLEKREPKSLFYFSCENIADFKELIELLKTYMEFKESNSIKSSVVILDEITTPKEWYRAIKLYIDLGKFKNDVLIITGSLSIEIKREIELFPGRRGKGLDLIMNPLPFREFVKVIESELHKKISPARGIEEIEKKAMNAMLFENELGACLEKYMNWGGFPLSVANLNGNKEDAKKTYLSWIKNAVLKAERSDVIARQIIKVILETSQTDISWESISKRIEIKSPKTASAYVELFKSMFAINLLYNIDIQSKKIRFGKNKKIQIKDPLLFDIFEDWTLIKMKNKKPAIAESIVVEHLLRLFPDRVFFWKNGFEVDAVVLEKNKLYGFEIKWSEKPEAKAPSQLKNFIIITKKDYSKNPAKIPLAVFLSVIDI